MEKIRCKVLSSCRGYFLVPFVLKLKIMDKLTEKQIVGFVFSFLLIIFSFVALMFNKEVHAWGWLLATGVSSFIITLLPKLEL